MAESITIKVKCHKCPDHRVFEAKIDLIPVAKAYEPSDIIVYCPEGHPNKVRLHS